MSKNTENNPFYTTMSLMNIVKADLINILLNGPMRYSEILKKMDNASKNKIIKNLKEMEQSGLIMKTIYPEVPPRVEYSLTDLGKSMKPINDAVIKWGNEYNKKIKKNQ